MWTKPNISRLFAVAALLGAGCSTAVNADSFKDVTAPSPAQEPNSSIRVFTAPSPGQELGVQSNSSVRVFTAPRPGEEPNSSVRVFNRSDQVTAQRPRLDEPPPGQEFRSDPGSVGVLRSDRNGCSHNETTLPCATIQQVILPPGTERQVVFSQKIARIFPSDPEVINPILINDHEIIIRAVRQKQTVTKGDTTYTNTTQPRSGNSDVFVYDPDSNLIAVIEVIIDEFAYRPGTIKDQSVRFVTPPHFYSIEIYDGKNLRREPYHYRCTRVNGCTYVGPYVGNANVGNAK